MKQYALSLHYKQKRKVWERRYHAFPPHYTPGCTHPAPSVRALVKLSLSLRKQTSRPGHFKSSSQHS